MKVKHPYSFAGSEHLITPALIYYQELIHKNTQTAIRTADGAEHLWPHIKSHKMADVIQLSMNCGITRFKCATIAEAEVAASCGAKHIIVAYPLVGPNIERFLHLSLAFPKTHFYAIGDNLDMLTELGKQANNDSRTIDVLVDVNMGMDRTGVPIDKLVTFCDICSKISGITLKGLHCYDGHRTEHDYEERKKIAVSIDKELLSILKSVQKKIPSCELIILGGSPSFPCHTDFPGAFFSPGTLFIYDYGYSKKFPDLAYTPAAAILTRVISNPNHGIFSLDLGYKGIAADPDGTRGLLLGIDHCEEMFQSEEHWTFRMKPGHESECPKVGDELFVIPTHICPTSALYPSAIVVEDGKIIGNWPVSARNRKITY